MVNYRRNHHSNGLYFFTVTLKDRTSTLLTEQINLLKQVYMRVQKENPFKSHAIVVLPDHIHTIWQMPDMDQNYSLRWSKIKSYFTHAVSKNNPALKKNLKGEFNLWQSRFWEHTLQNEEDYENHVNYIHYNPVKHGMVKTVADWPYSSFHQYVAKGLLNKDWGESVKDKPGTFGEK